MTPRAFIASLLVLALVIGGWVGGPRLLRRIAFFRVHQVDVVGNRYLDEQELVRRLALPADASIFDDLTRIRAAVRGIAGTLPDSAQVERRFPGTLRVRIVEAVPVGLTPVNGQLALVDARGKVLPFDPTRVPTSLPVVESDSLTMALLTRLRGADPEGFSLVQSARPDHGDILLDLGEHSVRVRPNADREMLRFIAKVRGYLETNNRNWIEIDARYRGRVFIRKAKA